MIKNNDEAKLILITGGNQGLGRSIAESCLCKDAVVIITSRKFAVNSSTKIPENNLIEQYLDVTSADSIINLFKWISTLNLSLKVLVNNAGIGVFKSIVDSTFEDITQVLSTNFTGAFLCAKEAFKIMKQSGGGRIINIGSIAEKYPLTHNSIYSASKAALHSLSTTLNEEGKFNKIRATHITLGAVFTPIWETRKEFSASDMLSASMVAKVIRDIAFSSLDMRIDHIEITPEKGLL